MLISRSRIGEATAQAFSNSVFLTPALNLWYYASLAYGCYSRQFIGSAQRHNVEDAAMVEYGERAGSGLYRIFHTGKTVYHCKPTMESTASSGVDRTVLRLSFEGHQPYTGAMRRLYYDPEAITFKDSTQGSTAEIKSKGEITQENGDDSQESNGENLAKSKGNGKSNGERAVSLLRGNGEITLPEVAQMLKLSLGGIEKIVRQLKSDGRLV